MEQKIGYHEYLDDIICPWCDHIYTIEEKLGYFNNGKIHNMFHNINFQDECEVYSGTCPVCQKKFPIRICIEYKYTTGTWEEE